METASPHGGPEVPPPCEGSGCTPVDPEPAPLPACDGAAYPGCPSSACEALAAGDGEAQIAAVSGAPACAARLVDLLVRDPARHLDAFAALVASPVATDALFDATYAALHQDRLRFSLPVVKDLHARLPPAVEACAGAYRCPDWRAFVLPALHGGRLLACGDPGRLGAEALLATVPYGDHACTEAIAAALGPRATGAAVTRLLELAAAEPVAWSRRNALRVLGRLATRAPGDAARALVVDERRGDVTLALEARLAADPADVVLDDAIWVLDTAFHPHLAAQPRLEAIALDRAHGSATRFRAIAAAGRLLWSRAAWSEEDVSFLERAVASDDRWVRADGAHVAGLARAEQLAPGLRDRLVAALHVAYRAEADVVPLAWTAGALDRLEGTALRAAVQAAWEAEHLPRALADAELTLRAALPLAELEALRADLDAARAAFFRLLGAPFEAPLAGEAPPLTVVVHATRAEYDDYMDAFVGTGAGGGGLFVEGAATLHTWDRAAGESRFTLRELLRHEYGHALQARHVFPGAWGDPGYFEEPRGWADEGLAELLAGLAPDGTGGLAPAPRAASLAAVCAAPRRSLAALLAQREGYELPGWFDYDGAWAFAWYLHARAPEVRGRLFGAWRGGAYHLAAFAALAGVPSLGAVEDAWHAALEDWCAAPGAAAKPGFLAAPGMADVVVRVR